MEEIKREPMLLDQEKINEYVRGGGSACPYCGSRDMESGSMEADGDYCWCVTDCNNCHARWQDSYRLVGLIQLREGPSANMENRL